ncbi:hypothetical protein [Lysinibacillus sp. 54212]|uniref:hypothetical protein n=1 Tax=Lysinibacillus sp. 54212 TaxID=3119829 RepID=UPI002FC842F5
MNNSYQEVHPTVEVSTFGNPKSVKHWLLNLLIYITPIVGFVFLIIWAIGTMGTGEIKKNFARAHLVVYGIIFAFLLVVVISGVIYIVFTGQDPL